MSFYLRIFINFVFLSEFGRSDSSERLFHSERKPAAGRNRTRRCRKGQSLHLHKCWHFLPLTSLPPHLQSSLLSSILGELPAEKGVLKVKGQMTYAAQQPWVFPGTIRSNILFGKEFDQQKYDRVVKACALKRVRIFKIKV